MAPRIGFTVPADHVVHETIDGETVIFHLTTGVYYSLTEAGVDVWHALLDGCTVEEIAERLAGQYEAPRDDLETAVAKLLSELEHEDLIVAAETAAVAAETAASETRRPFTAPELKKYDDMQDLLLIDPIHDVEEQQGWPVPKSERTA